MKEIQAVIDLKKQEFARLPLFSFMRRKDLTPWQRVAWAPAFAPYVHTFGDINRYIFPIHPADTKLKKMINNHAAEDGKHWHWFLKDIDTLGFNVPQKFGDTLRFLWGEETALTRKLGWSLIAYSMYEEDPEMTLVVIECIEATGAVALVPFADVGEEMLAQGQRCYYFATNHLDVESGHIQGGVEDVEDFLDEITFSPEKRERALEIVDKVFAGFTESMNEMYEYCVRHKLDQPVTASPGLEVA